MVLNVNQKGEILFNGEPWLLAAFLARRPAQLVQPFEARMMPYPFQLELADGSTVWGERGDFLVKGPQGYCKVSAQEFAEKYKLV